jgi:hypothetical protein
VEASFKKGEEVRDNAVFNCGDIVRSEESFSFAVNVARKKRETIGGCGWGTLTTHEFRLFSSSVD